MHKPFDINLTTHDKIDRAKWDRCIHASGGILYGSFFYLERMAEQWDALTITNPLTKEYDAVMPLTWNKKFGITYLYQPFLTPQAGIFSPQTTEEMEKSFLDEVTARFKFAEINLNISNRLEAYPGLKKNNNYFLPLNSPFEQLSEKFNTNLVRNYRKAVAAGCEYRKGIPLSDVLRLAGTQLQQYAKLKKNDLFNFQQLCEHYISVGQAQTIGVCQDNQLQSACVFLFGDRRAYYILAGNHPTARKNGASHFLLHEFIREQAGKDLILDFAGSDFPSIAFFYECFGARVEHYSSWKLNRLPVPLRWIKR